MSKKRKIEEKLLMIDKCLDNATKYLAKGVNVEGQASYHFDDWNGNSGHPLWIKNVMIPATERYRDKNEEALETVGAKDKEKRLTRRKRQRS